MVSTGTQGRFREVDFESIDGYGLHLQGTVNTLVDSCWFESNGNHNIFMEDCTAAVICNSNFNAPLLGGTNHIRITRSVANQRDHITIHDNQFNAAAPSGVSLSLGTNVDLCKVYGNRNLSLKDGTISDSGTRNRIFANDANSGVDYLKFGGTSSAPLRMTDNFQIQTTAAASAGVTQFAVSDSTTTNYFYIGTRGVPVFRTGDKTAITGSDELQTNSFGLYWDEATATIRARVRNNAGAYSTHIVGGVQSAAYTTSNVSTDRTYDANATTTDELADVLGTLIADLKAAGILS